MLIVWHFVRYGQSPRDAKCKNVEVWQMKEEILMTEKESRNRRVY
jgi:hypothetical protein